MLKLLRFSILLSGLVIACLASSAFAAGGTCPSGSNYVNPASSTTTGVTLSSLGITTCFYASSSGSDANSGTSEASPWLHLPGMSGCSNNCSSITPAAGQGFILEGGSVYYYSGSGTPVGAPWSISWNGTSTNPIYFGVDPTWYSGSSWTRPVITGNNPTTTNTTVSSCAYADDGNTFISQAAASYSIVDDIEITGACYASSGFTLFYTGSSTQNSWTRNYAHGWTRAASCSGSGCGNGPAAFMTDNGPNVGANDVWAFDVVDGSDTAGNIVSGILWNCYDVHGSVIRYVANQLCDAHTFHDNWLNNTTEPTFSGDHGNTMEENMSWTGAGANTYYNNLTSYAGTAVDWWLNPQPGLSCSQGGCDYVFNNVFYQINSPGNTFNIGENNGDQGPIYFFNNTFENPNNDVILTCGVSGYAAPFTAANNHYITDNSTAYAGTCSGQGTYVTERLMSHATATTDGYTASETYAYSPTSSSSPTVGAGTNETTFCTNISSQGGPSAATSACENDTTYACSYNSTSHSVSCPARTVNNRASSGAWDQGAYAYGNPAPAPNPPTGLSAVVN